MAKPGDPASSGPPWWVTAASVLIIPVIITLITQFYSYQAQRDEALQKIQTATSDATARIEALKSEAEQKSRELDIRMVEIALSLVKPDPNVDPTKIGAREWAIDVMERFSGIRFSPSARKSIIETAVPVEGIPKGAPPPLSQRRACPLSSPSAAMSLSSWTTRLTSPNGPTGPATPSTSSRRWSTRFNQVGHAEYAALGRPYPPRQHRRGLDAKKVSSITCKIYGTPVKSGTCFNLVGLFATTGYLFGKITDAECPPAL